MDNTQSSPPKKRQRWLPWLDPATNSSATPSTHQSQATPAPPKKFIARHNPRKVSFSSDGAEDSSTEDAGDVGGGGRAAEKKDQARGAGDVVDPHQSKKKLAVERENGVNEHHNEPEDGDAAKSAEDDGAVQSTDLPGTPVHPFYWPPVPETPLTPNHDEFQRRLASGQFKITPSKKVTNLESEEHIPEPKLKVMQTTIKTLEAKERDYRRDIETFFAPGNGEWNVAKAHSTHTMVQHIDFLARKFRAFVAIITPHLPNDKSRDKPDQAYDGLCQGDRLKKLEQVAHWLDDALRPLQRAAWEADKRRQRQLLELANPTATR